MSVCRTPELLLTPRISAISARYRLLVGDDRERFERLHRQLGRRALVEQLADPLVQLGFRRDLVAPGNFDDLQAPGAIVVRPHGGERGVDVFLRFAVEQLVERLRRDGFRRREDQRLDDRFQVFRHVLPFANTPDPKVGPTGPPDLRVRPTGRPS
jgi:hypothetical protein